jgi:hypothetical protein
MSEAKDLNESSSPDPAGEPANSEIESLLRSLVPRRPDVDRDVLFFQAGMAAARRGSARGLLARSVWPSVAATLLVACGGLAAELARKSTALEAALAAVASQPAGAVAADSTQAGQGAIEPRQTNGKTAGPQSPSAESVRFDVLRQDRRVEQVISLERVPGSRLTAHGWIEAPPRSPAWEIEPAPAEEPKPLVRPIRLPAYLELLSSERG